MVGLVWAIASAIGPLLGGVFTEKVTWRWCFYINIPFQGIAFIIIAIFLKLPTPKTSLIPGLKAIDWIGCLAIVGGIVMFLMGLQFGGVTYPWDSAIVLCLIIFGGFTIFLFVINEWKLARYPVIPLHIFKYRSNIACLLVCFFHGFVFIGASFYLPLYFQAILGHSPIGSGVLTLAFALALSLTSMATGIFIRKTGKYLPPIWAGLALMTLGFGLLTNLDAHSSLAKIVLYQIVAGFGVGPNFQAPLIALQSLIPPRDIASAVATFQLTRNVATSMSVVIGAVVLQNSMQNQRAKLEAELGPATANQLAGFNIAANSGIIKSLPAAQRDIARDAFAAALHKMWIMYVVLAACGLLSSFLITKQVLKKQHEVTKTGLEAEEAKRVERQERRRSRRESRRGSSIIGSPTIPDSPGHAASHSGLASPVALSPVLHQGEEKSKEEV
jgi:MFS family permease